MGDVCPHCGDKHRMMEPCPNAPGLLTLLTNWAEGNRGVMEWIALCGFLWTVFVVLFLILALV